MRTPRPWPAWLAFGVAVVALAAAWGLLAVLLRAINGGPVL